jgi:predicted GNAT family acetyltransferase
MGEAASAYDPDHDPDRGTDAPEVRDVPHRSRFELRLDGAPVGHLSYRREGEALALLHAEVEPGYEGRGLGTALVSAALVELRDRGEQVLPYCSFVRVHVRRHEELHTMVPAGQRGRFGLG